MNNITQTIEIPKDISKPSFIYNEEEVRPIPDAPGYYVSNGGNVYSTHKNGFNKMKPFLDGKRNYLQIQIKVNGKYKKVLLHRLVAIVYIPNPYNLPEVNHIDKNKQNCHYTNLEWCTRKQNLNDSYSTASPTRNYRVAKLYKNNEFLGEFKGIAKAARYANKKFGISLSSLDKYLKCGEFCIKYDGEQNRRTYETNLYSKTRKHGKVRLYRIDAYEKERFVKEFKSYTELVEYFDKVLGIQVSVSTISFKARQNKTFRGYVIKRQQ